MGFDNCSELSIPNLPGDSIEHKANLFYIDGATQILSASIDIQDEIVCAFDPNDKSVLPPGIQQQHLTIYSDTLEYTIRFQNTGNDTAFYVKVIDTLDFNLDPGSIHDFSSSHSFQMTNDNGILTFDFPGCNLPPDSLDYAASCGYIRFKVNAFSAISNNTVVTNSASIYFNFNDPFITNEVFNTMVYSITGKEEILSIIQHAKVNPNPFSDETIISFPNPDQSKFTISIKSMTGEEVANYITFLDEIRILGANLAPGIYIAELSSHKTTFHSKLLVH